jgi:hypothetical protein
MVYCSIQSIQARVLLFESVIHWNLLNTQVTTIVKFVQAIFAHANTGLCSLFVHAGTFPIARQGQMSFSDPPESGDEEFHSFKFILYLFNIKKNKNSYLRSVFSDPIFLVWWVRVFPPYDAWCTCLPNINIRNTRTTCQNTPLFRPKIVQC